MRYRGGVSPPNNAFSNPNNTQDAHTDADVFRVEPSTLIQTPRLISKEAADTNHTHEVCDSKGPSTPVAEGGELTSQPAISFAALVGGGLFLGWLVYGTRLLLAANAVGLGIGLDLLIVVVVGDSADRRGIDIDQRGGGGLNVALDGRRNWCSGLKMAGTCQFLQRQVAPW